MSKFLSPAKEISDDHDDSVVQDHDESDSLLEYPPEDDAKTNEDTPSRQAHIVVERRSSLRTPRRLVLSSDMENSPIETKTSGSRATPPPSETRRPVTPSRRSSGRLSRTPPGKGRTPPGRGDSTPRRPRTPLILKAMEDAATPRRNRLLLTPTRNKANRRYSPRNDLMMLGRLLAVEKEEFRKKRKLDSPKMDSHPLGQLYEFITEGRGEDREVRTNEIGNDVEGSQDALLNSTVVIESQSQSQSQSHSQSQDSTVEKPLDQGSDLEDFGGVDQMDEIEEEEFSQTSEGRAVSVASSDRTPRRSRMSSRLSLGTSVADDSNIAIPEAIIREQGDYGQVPSDEEETPGPELSFDNVNNDYDQGQGYEDILDNPDLSLIRDVYLNRPERLSFITLRKHKTKNSLEESQKSLVSDTLGVPTLRRLCRLLLPAGQARKLSSLDSLKLVDSISNEFFGQELDDLDAYVKHDKRKKIAAEDVKLLMHRSRLVPELDLFDFKGGANSLDNEIMKLGSRIYDMEDIRELETLLYSQQISKFKKIERKKKRDQEMELEEEEEEEEAKGNEEEDENPAHNPDREFSTAELGKLESTISIGFQEFDSDDSSTEIPMAEDEEEEEEEEEKERSS